MIGHLFLVDFITNPRLRKNAFFFNLMWMVKKILILEFKSLVMCVEGVRQPIMLVQGKYFVLIKP